MSIDDEFAQTLFNADRKKYSDFLTGRQMDLSIALKGTPDQRRRYLQTPTREAGLLKAATLKLEKAWSKRLSARKATSPVERGPGSLPASQSESEAPLLDLR